MNFSNAYYWNWPEDDIHTTGGAHSQLGVVNADKPGSDALNVAGRSVRNSAVIH